MKQYNYVYKITNLVNGKIYIGKHSTDDLDDGYMGSSRRVKLEYSAIGKENFEKTILAYSNDEEELKELEKFYIAKLNATDPDVGYNIYCSSGGFQTLPEGQRKKISKSLQGKEPWNKGVAMSEEQKHKLSETMTGKLIGEKHPMYGKKRSEETKLKISESLKGKKLSSEHKQKLSEATKGKNNPMYGKHHSDETRQKMCKSLQGKEPWNKGKHHSEETKQKMRLAWQRRKLGV